VSLSQLSIHTSCLSQPDNVNTQWDFKLRILFDISWHCRWDIVLNWRKTIIYLKNTFWMD